MQFAQRLDGLLIERGISAYQISKSTGISDRLIGYWRKGEKQPTLTNAAKLSEYLGVSVDWLLKGEENATSLNNEKTAPSPESVELLRIFESVNDVWKRIEILQMAKNIMENSKMPQSV